MIDKKSLHFLRADEVIIPESIKSPSAELMYAQSILPSYSTEINNDNIILKNKKSENDLWIIHTQNKITVEKGNILGLKVKVETEGLEEIHGKLMWLDKNKTLYKTEYVPYNDKSNEFYLLTEIPDDGYVQLCYFSRSDKKNDGSFKIIESTMLNIDDFTKIEGSMLYPKELYDIDKIKKGTVKEEPFSKISIKNFNNLVYNECYNSLWKAIGFKNNSPIILNFIHNGYILDSNDKSAYIILIPTLFFTYYICIIISFLSIILGISLSVYIKIKILSNN